SDAPAPGGGSVSALCGSLAAALAEMVGNLTLGRRGCDDAQESIREALAELEEIRTILLKAIDEDSESFIGFMTALKMPKNTEEEKALRKTAMSQALKTASLVPLKVAGQSVRIFKFSRLMLERGNKNAATDAMVSALAARTAAIGALLNVRINLRSIHDPEFVRTTLEEVLRLETLTNEQEKEITEIGYQLLNQ
ncbi:cyclodeaminase/cyclohydrolase family protein, partial [Parasutterella excrementihominis]